MIPAAEIENTVTSKNTHAHYITTRLEAAYK